uniref:Uncharacterized protein n=1 Tax=Glossina pallidipes TaxID=7398 RepID=A0A1A9ZQA9_GLOPL
MEELGAYFAATITAIAVIGSECFLKADKNIPRRRLNYHFWKDSNNPIRPVVPKLIRTFKVLVPIAQESKPKSLASFSSRLRIDLQNFSFILAAEGGEEGWSSKIPPSQKCLCFYAYSH